MFSVLIMEDKVFFNIFENLCIGVCFIVGVFYLVVLVFIIIINGLFLFVIYRDLFKCFRWFFVVLIIGLVIIDFIVGVIGDIIFVKNEFYCVKN